MFSHLQLALLMHFVQVKSQTCYTECLSRSTGDTTAVNVVILDGSQNLFQQTERDRLTRKTIEFNGLFPAITVTPIDVPYKEMLNEAEEDLESGRNIFDAYIIPYMNLYGGTSRLADRLMDLSTFTVDNVNEVAWHTIERYFRAYYSLHEGQVLTLPLAGDFFILHHRADVFTKYGMAVPRTLGEYVRASQALNGTDMNGDGSRITGRAWTRTSPPANVS